MAVVMYRLLRRQSVEGTGTETNDSLNNRTKPRISKINLRQGSATASPQGVQAMLAILEKRPTTGQSPKRNPPVPTRAEARGGTREKGEIPRGNGRGGGEGEKAIDHLCTKQCVDDCLHEGTGGRRNAARRGLRMQRASAACAEGDRGGYPFRTERHTRREASCGLSHEVAAAGGPPRRQNGCTVQHAKEHVWFAQRLHPPRPCGSRH